MTFHKLRIAAICAGLLSLLILVFSPPVRAQPAGQLQLSCIGNATTYYSPGLLATPREISTTWTDNYTSCLPNASNIDSGVTNGSAVATISCTSLLGQQTAGSQRIDWNNNTYSIMSWAANDVSITGTPAVQIYTVNATVTAGAFLGARVTEVIVLATPNLLGCLSEPGVITTEGSITLLVQSLL